MSRSAAVMWLLPGFLISIVDAWLSMQSMVGVMQPGNHLAFVAAIIVGMALTAFAVLSPLWVSETSPPVMHGVRFILIVIDVATSIVGAIWYGLMDQPLSRTVQFQEMHFDPRNWFATSMFVAFVVIVAFCCHMFGRAMRTLKS